MRRRAVALLGALAGVLVSCSNGGDTKTATAVSATVATTATPTVTNSATPTTVATTRIPNTTIAATTIATTVAPTTIPTGFVQQIELGRSVEGRPIIAVERGTPGASPVLVIGCIHGDEAGGVAVVDDLMTATVPAGVDLWLVPSMNPDGQAHETRQNVHQVDLNRNFPKNWAPLGQPGDSQYAGTGPASEPETAAVVGLIKRVRPTLTMWYHQDLNRIDVGTGRAGQIQRRYAELTGLPVQPVTGGTYTGTATQWESAEVTNGVAFIVELGPTVDDQTAATHANAVLTLAASV